MPTLVLDHPLARHHVTVMRDEATPSAGFRRSAARLTELLFAEATRDLALEPIRVRTPLVETAGHRLAERIGLVPILRAGLGMLDPILNLVPEAQVWHLGFYRDEETLAPVAYYNKLPPGRPVDLAFVIDPMLATGGSALAALRTLHSWGCTRAKVLSLFAAPEGVAKLAEAHPEVPVHICTLDERLNERGFILPGLGDAGDRMFNTLRD
jgi:uracil phosphoribosyltransferase